MICKSKTQSILSNTNLSNPVNADSSFILQGFLQPKALTVKQLGGEISRKASAHKPRLKQARLFLVVLVHLSWTLQLLHLKVIACQIGSVDVPIVGDHKSSVSKFVRQDCPFGRCSCTTFGFSRRFAIRDSSLYRGVCGLSNELHHRVC